MKKLFIVSWVIFALALAFLWGANAMAKPYSTKFPLTESPISEKGNWINGGTVGLDWYNCQTNGTMAFGTDGSGKYTDPTSVLTGTWGPNQTVTATVYTVRQTDSLYQEVELRLRTTITAHSITGYEINFRCLPGSDSKNRYIDRYIEIVRWNGAVRNFTHINRTAGPGIKNGDVVKATISGSTITAYVNGTQVLQGIDSTYTSGNPGIGFNYGCNGTYGNFGFTSFTASDGRFRTK
jgi:hypothetical protein